MITHTLTIEDQSTETVLNKRKLFNYNAVNELAEYIEEFIINPTESSFTKYEFEHTNETFANILPDGISQISVVNQITPNTIELFNTSFGNGNSE
ncbi:hypothetical protein [Psychroserpens ponticola]|uniref:Uncharacterized protein n=1 Tax=Psychroserpens ponticola TaxID=2932268 RepID=A0ABY7RWQ5_9FLAO|nr:hypothetical protein [Psychroserpens ponticola]WCO01116.1 hypothetical protein MUN68_013715 [Psychroserpens ponticola]